MPLTEHSLSNASAILLTAAVFGLIFYDARKDLFRLMTARTATLLSVFMWFLLEALRLPPDLRVYTQAEYEKGMLCVAIATLAFLFGYSRGRSKLFDDLGQRLLSVENENVVWTLFLGGAAIGIGPMLYFADFKIEVLFDGLLGGRPRFSGVLQRGRFGDLRGALLELQMFLNAVIPLAAVLLFTRNVKSYRRIICLLFITWMFLRANASGTRSAIIPVLLPTAAAIFWHAPRHWQKQLLLAGIPCGLICVYFYSAFVVANRDSGTASIEKGLEAANDYTGFEMFRELVYILDNVPEPIDYQYGRSYLNQAINPIPRFIWKSKPIWDAGILLANAKGNVDQNGVAYMTNSPGYVGETYLNFGYLGVVMVPLLSGWLVKAWDRLFSASGSSFLLFTVYAAGLASVFASGRSIGISTFYGLLALYVLLVIIETLTGSHGAKNRYLNSQASPHDEAVA